MTASEPTLDDVKHGFSQRAVFDENATSPLVLVDFDGVINALTHRNGKPDRNVWNNYVSTTVMSSMDKQVYPVTYSPTVTSFFGKLLDMGAEVVWLTTWCEDTTRFADLFGTPPGLKWLGESAYRAQQAGATSKDWWKLPLAHYYAADRPLVWLDDDLESYVYGKQVRSWHEDRKNVAPSLLLAPQSRLGLTKRNLRDVKQFVERHTNNDKDN